MQGLTSVQNMTEDNSTPLLKESLEKCFIEQQLALKQLTVQYEDLEDKVELVDCFYTQLDGNQEENRRDVEKLEKRVTELEVRMCKAEADVESAIDQGALDEGDRKIDVMDERISVLKIQNIELREHLNLVTDMVNNITRVLNKTFNNNEPADKAMEIDNTQADEAIVVDDDDDDEPAMEDNEPMQRTLRQVYGMYQSQPMDEEGWDEMTKAIEAAEEYEASLQKQQQQEPPIRVNGLTQDEWNDLLRI